MKQFSLEEYLKHPSRKVVTRDGRPVRILCTDAKGYYPVIALISSLDNEDYTWRVRKDGSIIENEENNSDLFFDTCKKEGWANLYMGIEGNVFFGRNVYASKEKAEEFKDNEGYLDTVRFEWEE